MLLSKLTTAALALALVGPPVDLRDMGAVLAEAERLWSEGENQAVADLFRRAYAESPQPEYLFGRARAEIRQGNCTAGRVHLDQFLATSPPPAQVDAAQTERSKCPEPKADRPPPVEVTPVVTHVEAPPPLPPEAVADEPRPTDAIQPGWRRDPVGWTLVGIGAAGVATGMSLFLAGRSRAVTPDPTQNETEYRNATRRGQRIAWTGLGIGSGGIVLALAGAIRLGLLRARGKRGTMTSWLEH